MTAYRIRPATAADAAIILRFIRELADYENALDEVAATEETVATSLFGEGSVSFAAICETEAGEPAGSAVFAQPEVLVVAAVAHVEELRVDAVAPQQLAEQVARARHPDDVPAVGLGAAQPRSEALFVPPARGGV